jgi:hypothetical protein
MASDSKADGGKKPDGRTDGAAGEAAVLEEDVYAKQERLFAGEPPETTG